MKVARPEFDPVQDCRASSLQTTIMVATSILGMLRTPDIVENGRFSCREEGYEVIVAGNKDGRCSNMGPTERLFRFP